MSWVGSALFYAWVVLSTVVLGVLSFGVRAAAPQHALWLGRLWARWLMAGLRVCCGIRWRLMGAEHLPADGPMLLAAQHQSAFDALVWMNVLPRVSYVFKSELAKLPIVGPMLLASGQIPVRRAAGGAALPGLLAAAGLAVSDRRQIIIFPQGTRTAPGIETPLRAGVAALAQATGLPVLPIATDSGRVWTRGAFRLHPGVVHIVVGLPISGELSTACLLDAVSTSWRASELYFKDVDNSVGE